MVVEFFEVVLGGCRSFLLLVTTSNSLRGANNLFSREKEKIGFGELKVFRGANNLFRESENSFPVSQRI